MKSVKKPDKSNPDSIYSFIKHKLLSKYFRNPLKDFIDENCASFIGKEENSNQQYKLFNEFNKLVEKLLNNILKEGNLSQTDFLTASEKGLADPKYEEYFTQLINFSDFLFFKKLMTDRNRHLVKKAEKQMRLRGITKVVKDDDEEVQKALYLSLKNNNNDSNERIKQMEEDQLLLAIKQSMDEYNKQQQKNNKLNFEIQKENMTIINKSNKDINTSSKIYKEQIQENQENFEIKPIENKKNDEKTNIKLKEEKKIAQNISNKPKNNIKVNEEKNIIENQSIKQKDNIKVNEEKNIIENSSIKQKNNIKVNEEKNIIQNLSLNQDNKKKIKDKPTTEVINIKSTQLKEEPKKNIIPEKDEIELSPEKEKNDVTIISELKNDPNVSILFTTKKILIEDKKVPTEQKKIENKENDEPQKTIKKEKNKEESFLIADYIEDQSQLIDKNNEDDEEKEKNYLFKNLIENDDKLEDKNLNDLSVDNKKEDYEKFKEYYDILLKTKIVKRDIIAKETLSKEELEKLENNKKIAEELKNQRK